MSVSFAGVPLPVLSPDSFAGIDHFLDPRWILEFAVRTWPDSVPTAFQGYLPTQPVKPGSLYWPQGAARFALGHYFATQPQLDAIRAAGGTGSLVISDGVNSISPTMSMLAARPLERAITATSGSPAPSGLYLLTLTDDRFRWWFAAGSTAVDGVTTTWAGLYAQIATALGITLTADTVNSTYLIPPSTLTQAYPPLPIFLDGVAFAVGQRIVRRLDGTVAALNATSGQSVLATNLALALRIKGDQFDLYPGSGVDLNLVLPQSVTVVFPRTDSGVPAPTNPTAIVETLSSLTLPELGTPTGFAGTKVWSSQIVANYISGVLQNPTDYPALAEQAATDWYRWQASGVDCCYSGTVPWVMDGMAALVEFVASGMQVTTRVQRGPWLDHLGDVAVPAGAPGSDGQQGRQGKRGMPGRDGEDGAQGLPIRGRQGQQGIQGNQGRQGKRGKPGEDGDDGPHGLPIRGRRGDPGPTGATGAAGKRGRHGVPGQDGEDGPQGLPIRGRQGQQGVRGVQGKRGKPGQDGEDGLQGLPIRGRQGQAGPTGPTGGTGERGRRGVTGRDGENGDPGPLVRGRHGPQGIPGGRGRRGIPGMQGEEGEPGERFLMKKTVVKEGSLTFSGAQVLVSPTQTIGPNTLTEVIWGFVEFDTNSYSLIVSPPYGFVVPSTGYYRVDCTLYLQTTSATATTATASIYKNGSPTIYSDDVNAISPSTGTDTVCHLHAILHLTAADIISVELTCFCLSSFLLTQESYLEIESLGS